MKTNFPRLLAAILLFLSPFILFAGKPVVAIDFKNVEEGIAEAVDRNYALHLGDKVAIRPNGPTAKPYAVFDGTEASSVRINPRQAPSKVKGDELSVSFWFRLDDYVKCDIGYGFRNTGRPPSPGAADYGMTRLRFDARLEPTDFGAYSLWTYCEGRLPTNVWHHVAFRYSMKDLRYTVWYDGVVQRDLRTKQDLPRPLKNFLTLPMAKGFPGAIADIRIWNTTVPDAEILAMEVSPVHAKALASAYDKAAASVPVAPNTTAFRNWCASGAKRVRALAAAGKADVRDWMRLRTSGLALPYLVERTREIAASGSGASLASFPGLPLSIYPYDMRKRLPWILPYDGKGDAIVSFDGARGEFEGRTFMVYPFRDVAKLHITAGDLTGPAGAKIPSSAIDVRVVKCWFTPGSGWNSYFGGGREFGTLSPELLLHDDAFIKVVRDERANYIRCSYPRGDRYIWTSEFGTPENMEPFDYNREPIHDAKTFQPLPVSEGALKQFWITVKIPSDAREGRYTGVLSFTADGKPCGTMPMTLEVHPFSLPAAATRYNIDRPFLGTWMNHINLEFKMTGGSYSNAVRRLFAEYKNMAEHNMLHPWTATFGSGNYPDFAEKQLELMEKAGLSMRPLFGDVPGADQEWVGMTRDPRPYNGDISVEGNRELFDRRLAAFSNRVARSLERIEKIVGHRDVHFYGEDEAGPGTVRREMPFFMVIRMLGGIPFITSGISEWAAFAVGADDAPAAFGRTHARNWHEGGATVCTYAAPFSGPENPETWRRNKGIRLYTSNFDGCNEYVWYEGLFVWNDFAFESRYKPFCIVYPTADGVVDTIAWEALREAFDDVRYLTLLRRLAREAMRSGDKELDRLGRAATIWAEMIDPESDELDPMRATAVDWIVRLQKALAAKGVDVPGAVYR